MSRVVCGLIKTEYLAAFHRFPLRCARVLLDEPRHALHTCSRKKNKQLKPCTQTRFHLQTLAIDSR